MQEALKQIKAELLTGTQNLFQEAFGFPLKQLTNQALPPVKFLKDEYNPAAHRIIQTVFLAGFISKESLSEIGETSDSALKSASRYPGMLLLAVELDSVSPSYTEIQKLTTAFNRATPAMPVTIVYRYNNGSRIALASCERFEYQQKHRIGERMGKTAILLDVNLHRPSKSHTELLSALKISKLPRGANEVEAMLEHWRDRLRCRDKHLLLEIAKEWLKQEKTLPPIEQVTEIFGKEAITIIRNATDWGSYYNFLREACQGDSEEVLEDSVMALVRNQVEESMIRHKRKPSITQIKAKHRKDDLYLFSNAQIEERLEIILKERQSPSETQQILEDDLVPDFLALFAKEAENALEQGISLKNSEESEEEDEESDSTNDDSQDSALPLSGPNLEDIEVRQSSLDAGEYDVLRLCKYSISKYNSKRLHTFVFERLISVIPEVTIGSVRKLDREELLMNKGFGQTHANLLDELKGELLGIAQKILFEQAISVELAKYSESDLDFELDFNVIPKSWMPIGTPQPKTLLRYFNEIGLSCNAANIRTISLAELASMKAIREFRIDQLIELKRALPYLVSTNHALKAFDQSAPTDERIIQRDKLSMWERITVTKILWLVNDTSLKVKHLASNFREEVFKARTPEKYHFKAKSGDDKYPILDDYRLASIKQKVARAILFNEKDFFVSNTASSLAPEEIDHTLLEHINQAFQLPFYKNQDKLLKAIHLIRRGFINNHWTLQSTADSGITGLNSKGKPLSRERIRQFQSNGERQLLWSLPIAPSQISKAIANLSVEQLSEQMPRLFTALHKNLTRFRRYLGFISQDLSVLLDVENTLLNSLFATTPGPITKQQVLEFISVELQKSAEEEASISDDLESQSKNILQTLILRNCLILDEDGAVRPTNLKHKEVIAHVYAGERDGLPTQDGLEIALSSELYPAKELSKRYLDQQINQNPYLFQSGKSGQSSLYKHINYLPTSVIGEELIQWIKDYFDTQSGDRIDLRSAFNSYKAPSDFDYYAFRHYIREFSIEEGLSIQFDGKSGVDNLKRAGASSRRITNKDRVFKLIEEVPEGMTLNEITNEFHCHSQTLVAQQIYNLIAEGKVWKISSRLFSTPNNFKATLDEDDRKALGKIKEGLKTLLVEAERIGAVLDTSLLAQKINNEQSVDFHKNLYTSIVSSALEYPELYKKRSLISRNPFPDITLSEVFARHCNNTMSQAEAIAEISQRVLATEECLKQSYHTWIYRLKNGKIQADEGEPKQTTKASAKIVQPTPTEAKVPAPTATSKKKVIPVRLSDKAKGMKEPSKKVPTKKVPVKTTKAKNTPAKKTDLKKELPTKKTVKKTASKKTQSKSTSAQKKLTPQKAAKKVPAKKAPAKNRVTQPAPVNKQKVTKKVKNSPSRSVAKKSTNRHSTTKKKVAKQAHTKKAATKKKVAKKAANKKVTAKKTSTRKSPISKKVVAKKTPSKKTDKKREKKEPAKKSSTKKTAAKKTAAKKRVASSKQQTKKKPQKNEAPQKAKKPGLVKRFFNALKSI